jgi:hypothetical protein
MKIAVCIPVHRDNKSEFTYSLSRMLVRTAQAHFNYNGAITRPEIEVFFKSSSIIALSRNMLADSAVGWGAHYILWADDDHTFPPDTLIRLLRHNELVVGCNFLCRSQTPKPVAVKDGRAVWTTETKAKADALEGVDALGFGLVLMNVSVLRGLDTPLFNNDLTDCGEDVFLCRKLRAAGVKIHVDHALSWECKHIKNVGLGFNQLREATNADSALPAARD